MFRLISNKNDLRKNISSMKVKEYLIRTVIVSLLAIVILYFFKLLVLPYKIPINPWVLVILYVVGVNIASEGNFLIDKYLDRRLPWHLFSWKRFWIQIGVTVLWTALMTSFSFALWIVLVTKKIPDIHFPIFALFTFIFGTVQLILYDAVIIAINFFRKWKESLIENERLKREKLITDYKLLQDQLNPHFLFNSFNVLISEISHNPKTAIEFTRRLSQVYRYVLQSKYSEVVSLKDELDFIKSYSYLHKIRIGECLKLQIYVDESTMEKHLPPLTIQILFENALKHNIASQGKPLTISIISNNASTLKVSNNLQQKESIDSTQTGLTNIKDRYSMLGDKNIFVAKTENEFSVTIPLLDK